MGECNGLRRLVSLLNSDSEQTVDDALEHNGCKNEYRKAHEGISFEGFTQVKLVLNDLFVLFIQVVLLSKVFC
ncbi:MAG: hypothetical protein ACMVP2_28425 [Imperialibacter sp.]|uniref:hypothetical protein n=1 Tax=Imperialibacter sp. TaxID=2038411 RepID=UPI003A89340D